jgi:hypothetical protein
VTAFLLANSPRLGAVILPSPQIFNRVTPALSKTGAHRHWWASCPVMAPALSHLAWQLCTARATASSPAPGLGHTQLGILVLVDEIKLI